MTGLTKHPRVRVSQALAGLVAPLGLAVLLAALTIAQRRFLEAMRFSPFGRNPVQWPSVMLFGPDGNLLAAGFIGAGSLLVWHAIGWWSPKSGPAMFLAASFAALGLALMVMAVPPSPASAIDWHNLLYPAIPAAWMCCVLAHISLSRDDPRWKRAAKVSTWIVLPGFVLGLLATGLDPVAQLARGTIFAVQLAWVVAVSIRQIAILRANRPQSPGPAP